MNTRIIIIVCIVGVLLGGGLVAWGLLQAIPADSGQTSVGTIPNSPPNSSSVFVPSPSGSQTDPIPDLDEEYAALYQKILAQKLAFTSVSSSAGEIGSLYALYAADIAEAKKLFPTAASFSISVALVDLNEDGTSEAMVLEDLPGYCGSGGCPLYIYKKEKGVWNLIYEGLSGHFIGMANAYTSGYQDLYLAVAAGGDAQGSVMRYVWNGTTYREWSAVATWDGATFRVAL